MNLDQYHSYYGGIKWKVTELGVWVDGQLWRSVGKPVTVRRCLTFPAITQVSQETGVPVALLVACMATESRGVGARREEPGYVSDDATPEKVSVGVMQTLISTARMVMQEKVDAAWLMDAEHSILAGARYMARQAPQTHYDPPLVAAAYNAGGIYEDADQRNPWRLRCYPLGTGRHITRFVKWYNDALAVLG